MIVTAHSGRWKSLSFAVRWAFPTLFGGVVAVFTAILLMEPLTSVFGEILSGMLSSLLSITLGVGISFAIVITCGLFVQAIRPAKADADVSSEH